MAELVSVLLAGSAGGCAALATIVALAAPAPRGARELLGRPPSARRPRPVEAARRLLGLTSASPWLGWLARRLELAGQSSSAAAAAIAVTLASLAAVALTGVTAGLVAGPLAAALAALLALPAVPVAFLLRLRRLAAARRERLLGELVPLLELVSLELSGGASPLVALEAVLARTRSELAEEIRAQLIGSRLSGSASFESRTAELAGRLELEPLDSLAMILGLSRDYGAGVSQGIRALAADLRRARRRRLIELSRGALNRVLVPAAAGILLPFMAILLFPALAVLTRSLGG